MNNFFSHIRTRKNNKQGGFSYIEVTIAVAIFVMLSSVLLGSYTTLNSRVNVDSLAHNIGQWVRDAQISAMSVRRSAISGTFPAGYGLHFETGTNNNRFIYYSEQSTPANRVYNPGVDSIENTIELLQGYTIAHICGGNAGTAVLTCAGALGYGAASVVDLAFARPDPDANITGNVSFGGSLIYSPVKIVVSSPRGLQRAIVVYATGQVSVQAP